MARPPAIQSGLQEGREGFSALLRECEELDELWLRTRFPGAAYVPANARRAVKVKTLMINCKIPLMERDRYPIVVTANNRIVWAPGLPVAREFAWDAEDEKCVLIIAVRADKTSARNSELVGDCRNET
jgi:tRNA(Ile)-lysidine synthetase-like protein